MLGYIGARVLASVPVLLGVTLAVFSLLFLIPGDPVRMMLAEFVTTPEQVERMRAQLHLDEPVLVQYGRFLWGALHGDLGRSIRSRRPVAQEIAENVGAPPSWPRPAWSWRWCWASGWGSWPPWPPGPGWTSWPC